MTTTPTVEEFLAQQDPEEAEADNYPTDPLASIAESLQAIAAAMADRDTSEQEQCEHAEDLADALRENAELERLHDAKQQLIEDTLKICEKSTSKLANSIRALLEPVVTVEEPEPKGREHTRTSTDSGPDYCAECSAEAQEWVTWPCSGAEAEQPAHDAPVEEWRAYARTCGYQGADVDTMNRSQIRTMLGIEHGGGE